MRPRRRLADLPWIERAWHLFDATWWDYDELTSAMDWDVWFMGDFDGWEDCDAPEAFGCYVWTNGLGMELTPIDTQPPPWWVAGYVAPTL